MHYIASLVILIASNQPVFYPMIKISDTNFKRDFTFIGVLFKCS